MIASMIFFPVRQFQDQPEEFGLSAEEVRFETEDEVGLHGWFFSATPHASGVHTRSICLVFLHGNAGNISTRLHKAKEWVMRGVSVLLFDYRGYGKSKGSIRSEEDLYRDSSAAIQWVKARGFTPSQIALYGESIGSVPAIHLAQKEKFLALILESPFTSLREIAKLHYGWAPAFFLKGFEMANEQKIPQIRSPVFILHGTDDEISPFEMGRRLFEQAPEPKGFLAVDGGTHNDLSSVGGKDFYEKPFEFILGL